MKLRKTFCFCHFDAADDDSSESTGPSLMRGFQSENLKACFCAREASVCGRNLKEVARAIKSEPREPRTWRASWAHEFVVPRASSLMSCHTSKTFIGGFGSDARVEYLTDVIPRLLPMASKAFQPCVACSTFSSVRAVLLVGRGKLLEY